MIKSLKVIFAAAVLALGLSSCLSGNNDTTRSDSILGCFAYVENVSDRQVNGFSGLSYDVSLNYTQGTAEITIHDLKLAEGITYANVKLSDLKFQINKEGWIEITSSAVDAAAAGASTPLKLTAVDIRLCDRMTNEGRLPGFYARYTVDSKYSVLSAASKQYQFGKTTSVSTAGEYETTATDYVFGFDAKAMTVNILMKNCRFVEKMPAMNILLEKVPVTVSGTVASFNVDEIIPKIGDTPYPGFAITSLSGYYDFAKGFVATFKCKPETMPLEFTVSIDCNCNFSK